MTYEAGAVICVPFPFTDRAMQKRRPALVLSVQSFNESHAHVVLAMITSAKNLPWASDVNITDLALAGLPSASVVRFKIFTIDERLVLGTLGKLANADKAAIKKRVANILL